MQQVHSQQQKPLLSKPTPTYRSLPQLVALTLTYSLGTFYFGYAMIYFGAIPIDTARSLYHVGIGQAVASGVINGCVPVGALIGSLLSSLVVSRLSRRKFYLLLNAVALVAGCLLYIPNFYSLVLCRLVQGVCVGAYSSITSMTVKQVLPVEVSGSLGSLVQTSVIVGMFTPYMLTYVLKKATGDLSCHSFWWAVFAGTLVTVALQTLILVFVYPVETPKYWLLQKRQDKARELVEMMYLPEFVEGVIEQKKKDVEHILLQQQQEENPESSSFISQEEKAAANTPTAKKGPNIALLVAGYIMATNQMSGANAVNIYCGPIAAKSVSPELALLMPAFVQLVKVAAALSSLFLLRRFGRKALFLPGLLSTLASLLFIGVGFLIKDDHPQAGEVLVVIGLFSFMLCFGSCLGSIVWLYVPEIVSPRQYSLVIGVNWTFCSMVVILFPIIEAHLLNDDPGSMFFFFALWLLSCFVLCLRLMVESKDKTEFEIRQEYSQLRLC